MPVPRVKRMRHKSPDESYKITSCYVYFKRYGI